MKNKNFWLFRVSDKWGSKIKDCLDSNYVNCGWNIGLSNKPIDQILEENPWASRMAIKFCYIKEGDIIIMPNHDGIAIGVAGNKQYRENLDWKDTINVTWLTNYYPRKDLISSLQSRLKFRGTFLNLNEFSIEFEKIINSDFLSSSSIYLEKIEKSREESIKKIAEHLNKRTGTSFQDVEFEWFILELFTLKYQGFVGNKNNQRQEFIDGKDLSLTYSIDDLDLLIELNIQVKQHSNNASFGGVLQINKSINSKENVISKNILVTTGNTDDEFRKKALIEHNVYVYNSEDIAKLIVELYDRISFTYQQKLNLFSNLSII